MTGTMEESIQARFDAVVSPLDGRDWDDVLRRARVVGRSNARRVSPRTALAAALAALAATVTAVAFGWPQTIIDFFSSPPAPTHVKNWFGAENVEAPKGMNPEALPGQARKIATATFDANSIHGDHPTRHTLDVAPRRGGGFCYLWTNASAGCLPAKPPSKTRAMGATGPLDLSWFTTGNTLPLLVVGWVRTGATRTVEAHFADGATAKILVTWVSAPINAGFLVYPVPPVHRTRPHALASVAALDAQGRLVGRQTFRLTQPLDQDIPQTLPDGTKISLPRRADAAKARRIISFRATDGSQVYLWVMPRAGGGDCFISNQSFGCRIPGFERQLPPLNGGLSGGTNRILFSGQTKPEVATVELRYQNGERERLTPVDGFVLHEITPAHWRRGSRLVAAVAIGRGDRAIFTERFRPQDTGVYPCKKPVDRGYGVKSCP